jgi:hypothetical protein
MTQPIQLKHRFVEFVPEEIEEETLYVSMEYGTVRHKCCCGCGEHVVTPLSPTDWKLTYDGESVSLHPSIGNWSFDCRSHYWIRSGTVIWAPAWTSAEVEAGRRADQLIKGAHYSTRRGQPQEAIAVDERAHVSAPPSDGLFADVGRWLARLLRRWR